MKLLVAVGVDIGRRLAQDREDVGEDLFGIDPRRDRVDG